MSDVKRSFRCFHSNSQCDLEQESKSRQQNSKECKSGERGGRVTFVGGTSFAGHIAETIRTIIGLVWNPSNSFGQSLAANCWSSQASPMDEFFSFLIWNQFLVNQSFSPFKSTKNHYCFTKALKPEYEWIHLI